MTERITLSIEEVADALGVSRDLVYDLAASGHLPTITLGRRKLVPRAALDEIIERALAGFNPDALLEHCNTRTDDAGDDMTAPWDDYDNINVVGICNRLARGDATTADAVLAWERRRPRPRKRILQAAERRAEVALASVDARGGAVTGASGTAEHTPGTEPHVRRLPIAVAAVP